MDLQDLSNRAFVTLYIPYLNHILLNNMFNYCNECRALGLQEKPEYMLAVRNFISLLQQYNLPEETADRMRVAANGCYLFRGLIHQSEFGLDKSNPQYWELLNRFAESACEQANDDPFYSEDSKKLLEEVSQYFPKA